MKRYLLLLSLLLIVAFANAQSSGYYKEGFEEDSFPPDGWTAVNLDSSDGWQQYNYSIYNPDIVHEGVKSAGSSISIRGGGIDYLITKQFTVTAGDSITFWFRRTNVYVNPDTLYIQVSTTNINLESFTTTIGAFSDDDGYPDVGKWKRASLSLDAFAGKNVYISFKHVNGDGITLDDVALGIPPAADIRVISMDVPDKLDAGATIALYPIFQNIGSQVQTFNVTVTAGTYSSTKTITALAPLSYRKVKFDITVPASYPLIDVLAYSSLTGDADTKNDTICKQAAVYERLVSQGWVIKPGVPNDSYSVSIAAYTAGTAPNDTGYIFSRSLRFNMRSNEWEEMDSIPPFSGAAFIYNKKIFYFESQFTGEYANQVSVYDIATNTWVTGADMPTTAAGYASCQYKDSLMYFINGVWSPRDEYIYYDNSVLIYNASRNTWSRGTDFPGIPSEGMRAGIVNNTIVMVGGYNEDSGDVRFSQAYRGDINPNKPEEITWTRIDDYPGGPVYDLGATGVISAKTPLVYFTGGSRDSMHFAIPRKDTWVYDINTNRWLHGPDKPTAGYYNGLAPFVFRDTVYIASIGGYDYYNGQSLPANEWLVLGAAADVLPVHLINFTAALQNNKTLLNWKVSEDGTGGHYIIQRAADAVHFSDMSETINAGFVSAIKTYSSYDLLLLKGYNYYRLKITNADGSVSYSEIKAVKNTAANAAVYAFSIYPNPTHGLLNIVLQNNSGINAVIGITISDVSGRKIVNENKTVGVSLSLNYKLKPGVYIVNLLSQDGTWKQSRQVVVE